jgi:glycosyltransferase involved in cell wall biosynthesis
MKVLHINSYFSKRQFYKNLYDRQINDGLDLDVFVPVTESVNTSKLSLGNYTMLSKNHKNYDRFFFNKKQARIYNDILQKFKIGNYSLVHAHSLFTNGHIAMKLKQEYGIPYVVAVRNTDINIFFKYMFHLRKLGINILKEADRIIFLSEPYRRIVLNKIIPNNLSDEIKKKTEVIPNGIDDFWFVNKGNNKKRPTDNSLKLIYVGEINKNKNVTTTIKAIEILRKKGYNINFTVVGDIKNKKVYNQIIKYRYVKYLTKRSKEELLDIYRSNEIFIMPSITETFGLVYAEAMSQGLPLIYTKDQGFDGQFNEGTVGFSVNCYDAYDISHKIIKVLDNYEQISKRNIKLVDKYNWDNIVGYYNKIYAEIIKG